MVRCCVAMLFAVALAGPPGQAGAQEPASPRAAAEAGLELAPPAAFDTLVLPSRLFFLRDLEVEYVARVRPGRLSMFAGGW